MRRPCFIVVDREYPANISTRKLVLETAKLNVITAYDAIEAIQTLQRFPNVDGVVLDHSMPGMACQELVDRLRAVRKDATIIVTSSGGFARCRGVDHHLDSHDPKLLLDTLHSLNQDASAELIQRDKELSGES